MTKPSRPLSRLVRSSLLALAAAALAPAIARATWSIVLVDTKTGEVAIGCATCLTGLDLETVVPVMVTGIGGACAQSSIDSSGTNRKFIWDKLQEGWTPGAILSQLSKNDPQFQSRQYGIVDHLARRATFTGTQCGAWAGGVAGKVGTLAFAIQGNVLTGQPVVNDALSAVLNTDGDLAEKLMAGMEAAQVDGGDGRCSCDNNMPDSCGSPPPNYDPRRDKSAHIGFMMISRIGDLDGMCDGTVGCANGAYYMNLNVANQGASDPDPVIQLRSLFDQFRVDHRGRPDHILSTKTVTPATTPGNGTKSVDLALRLVDWDGTDVGHGGATITVTHSTGSAGLSTIGLPIDHGDGTYTVPIVAGEGQGIDEFEIVVDDGAGAVTLYPFPKLQLTDTLVADRSHLSAAAGGSVNFSLFGPEGVPPDWYLLLCTGSGTSPGLVFHQATVPLNWDSLLAASVELRNSDIFVNTNSAFLPDGTQSAKFHVEANDLLPIVGMELDFAFFTTSPVSFASNFVPLIVDP
jgi:hypothetical protein